MNPETLKDWTRAVVDGFLVQKIPLNDGITKLAAEQHLNDKQIARVVEAANQTAYLKLHASSKDKTFEFPLASVAEIREKLLTPSHEKTAGQDASRDPFQFAKGLGHSLEKQATEAPVAPLPKPTVAEFCLVMTKEAEDIQRLAQEREVQFVTFHKQAEEFVKDPEWKVKLASVKQQKENIEKVAAYLSNSNLGVSPSPFIKDEELSQAHMLLEKFAKVSAMTKEIKERREKMEKVALVAEMAGGLGGLVPKLFHGVSSVAAKGVAGSAKYAAKNPVQTGLMAWNASNMVSKGKQPGTDQWVYGNE